MKTPRADASPIGPSPDAGWSIADVERETGLGKDTLRVWERRYGFPCPERDPQGERVYPLDQVERLRLIKRVLDAGHRPGKVATLTIEALKALLASVPRARAPLRLAVPGTPHGEETDTLTPWVRWLSEDRTDLLKQSLQQQVLRQGLGQTVEQLVAPLCVRVGEEWLRGGLSVYQEHLFTETVQSVLREAMASVDAGAVSMQQRPRVLLTTTPGEPHGLGLLMAECFFAMEGCTRFVLGVSTPVTDIVLAARQLRIDVLALSYSAYAARREVGESLRQLSAQLPAGVEVWVGGAGSSLRSRAVPPGVRLLRRAADVTTQVQAWRQRQASAPAPLAERTRVVDRGMR
jgi:MerR family transcriptional regulator, light-induced transcriptional regulator